MRPLVTIVQDSLSWYGVDEHGGRVHDLLGTRCDPYVNTVLSGQTYDFHCHSNLTRAVVPFGLNESDVHDVINLFQVTGLDEKGRYFMSPCPAQAGDHVEFLAEQDVLMALSTRQPTTPPPHPTFIHPPTHAVLAVADTFHPIQVPAPGETFLYGDLAATVRKR